MFDQLACACIAAHPSTLPKARWFGQHLPQFLAGDAALSSQPVLAETAAFEWAVSLAFDSADDPVLDIAELASLPSEARPTLGFQMHSFLQHVELLWNVPVFCQVPSVAMTLLKRWIDEGLISRLHVPA